MDQRKSPRRTRIDGIAQISSVVLREYNFSSGVLFNWEYISIVIAHLSLDIKLHVLYEHQTPESFE